MKCREVKEALVPYLDCEVWRSERTLMDAHLAGCESCERELGALSSSRRRVAGSLRNAAAQASPSAQAWSRLQERLAAEARGEQRRPSLRPRRGRLTKLRWRIALG